MSAFHALQYMQAQPDQQVETACHNFGQRCYQARAWLFVRRGPGPLIAGHNPSEALKISIQLEALSMRLHSLCDAPLCVCFEHPQVPQAQLDTRVRTMRCVGMHHSH